METNRIRLIWNCVKCKDVVISYSHLNHIMNWCECGSSGVDLDKHSQGISGEIKEISRKEFVSGTGWVVSK